MHYTSCLPYQLSVLSQPTAFLGSDELLPTPYSWREGLGSKWQEASGPFVLAC